MPLIAKAEARALTCDGEDQALTWRTDRTSFRICRSARHRCPPQHRIFVSNKIGFKRLFHALTVTALLTFAASGSAQSPSQESRRSKVMIVGISHLVAKQDLHNFDLGDPMSPKMQTQIADVMRHLVLFRPTKVTIEAEFSNQIIRQEYLDYLAGKFRLGPNENYQYGFRLAWLAHNKAIYPVDAQGFPFEFEKMQTFAKSHGQQSILDSANAENFAGFQKGMDAAIRTGDLLTILRFLNTPDALRENEGWYLVVDKIGAGAEYPGADLVSNWWARNLHIFANLLRSIDSPDDRVVMFIGQGHAAILRQFVKDSPDLELIDPGEYLK